MRSSCLPLCEKLEVKLCAFSNSIFPRLHFFLRATGLGFDSRPELVFFYTQFIYTLYVCLLRFFRLGLDVKNATSEHTVLGSIPSETVFFEICTKLNLFIVEPRDPEVKPSVQKVSGSNPGRSFSFVMKKMFLKSLIFGLSFFFLFFVGLLYKVWIFFLKHQDSNFLSSIL